MVFSVLKHHMGTVLRGRCNRSSRTLGHLKHEFEQGFPNEGSTWDSKDTQLIHKIIQHIKKNENKTWNEAKTKWVKHHRVTLAVFMYTRKFTFVFSSLTPNIQLSRSKYNATFFVSTPYRHGSSRKLWKLEYDFEQGFLNRSGRDCSEDPE